MVVLKKLQVNKNILQREIGLTNGGVKSTETRGQKFDWKIEIGLYLAHYSGMYCYNVSVLDIGLFQFSSQIFVTLISMLFTPPLVNPIYQQLSR